jgi:hypothetical protein
MLPKDGIFFSSVQDADAVISVSKGVVEEGVGHNDNNNNNHNIYSINKV